MPRNCASEPDLAAAASAVRAGDHDGVHGLVAITFGDGVAQLPGQLEAQRVTPARVGEGEDRDAALTVMSAQQGHSTECHS